mmetsp:Transcript_55395/g.155876  ORF Transcript_55395/g.155876 Transcript_55395/m.155876 type:complete len:208 (+) Transcript_55395:848-1471(+)
MEDHPRDEEAVREADREERRHDAVDRQHRHRQPRRHRRADNRPGVAGVGGAGPDAVPQGVRGGPPQVGEGAARVPRQPGLPVGGRRHVPGQQSEPRRGVAQHSAGRPQDRHQGVCQAGLVQDYTLPGGHVREHARRVRRGEAGAPRGEGQVPDPAEARRGCAHRRLVPEVSDADTRVQQPRPGLPAGELRRRVQGHPVRRVAPARGR